jgi:CheY-like chemotaxis protein
MTTAKTKERIVSVDDNLANQKVIDAVLTKAGYEVKMVMKGPQALETVRENKPALVLLDIMMPDMNGYEVIAALKQDPETSHIPVIFVTAKDQPKDLKAGFEAGAVDYVSKPFAFEELLARVNAQLLTQRQKTELEHMQRELEKLNGELFDYNIQTTETSSQIKRELEESRQQVEKLERELESKKDTRKMSTGSDETSAELLRETHKIVDASVEIAQMPVTMLRLIEEGQSRDLEGFCRDYAGKAESLQEELRKVLERLREMAPVSK